MHFKQLLAYILQTTGAASFVVAAALVSTLAAWLVAGVMCMVFGVVLERESAPTAPAAADLPSAGDGGAG